MFSNTEKNRRLAAAQAVMDKAELRAVYLLGNSVVGTYPFGIQRYFSDNRIVFFIRSIVFIKNQEPVAVVADLMNKLNLIQSSFVQNAVINADQVQGVIDLLKDNGIENGRVGTILEILPAAWLIRLQEALPGVEFVDVSEELFALRTVRSAEEIEAERFSARIADAGYKALCETAKPGVYENEVVAAIDKAMQKLGAEESFALITSGKFSLDNNNMRPLHNYSAYNREIKAGDIVAAEITPRYNGYWTQKVRTICIEEKNEDAEAIRQVIVGAIDAAKPIMKAGTSISDITKMMREYTENAGYKFVAPSGHLAGIDLDEGGTTETNTMLLRNGMLLILHPTVINDKMDTSIFWGESYIITDDGYEEPMQSGDALFTTGK